MTRPDLSLTRELEAALAWWQAAGVDCDFGDDATAWLAEAPLARSAGTAGGAAADKRGSARSPDRTAGYAPGNAGKANAPGPAARTEARNLLGDSPPRDLAAFRDWWVSAPGLASTAAFPRVPPRGARGAALMILVPQPEESDRERLLEGPQGRLLAAIVAAMGLEEKSLYLASALPCHTPLADCPALAAGGMDAVTLHHLELAAPQRLLVLGTALAPMLGATSGDALETIEHDKLGVPVMVSETLEAMLAMPRLKAKFWRRWMEWSAS